MQLVRSRPIYGPVERNGSWYDDFKSSKAKNPRYTLVPSSVVQTDDGIGLEAPGGSSSAAVTLPLSHSKSYSNFEAEWVWRGYGSPSAGGEIAVTFRYGDNNNRWYLQQTSTNLVRLYRVVGGVYSGLATISNVAWAAWTKIAIRAIGAQITISVNDLLRATVNDATHLTNGGVHWFNCYDPTLGVARGEWQYLVVRPLG